MKKLNSLAFLVFLMTILLLPNIAFAQNISGIYLNTSDAGPSQLVVKQVDETISAELDDGSNEIKLTGILEDNTLLFDTTEMPFTLTSTLNDDTITMLFQSKDTEEVESIEFSFKLAIALPTAARAPQHALSHLLKFVPATKEIYESDLLYVNLWAASGFRDAGVFQSQEDFLNFQKSEAYDAYIKNLRMYIHQPFDSRSLSPLWDDMPDTVGFSWFDIQASLSYGTLPKSGHLNLTTAARAPIKTTLTNLGFVEEAFQEQTILTKGEDGTLDIDNRNLSNPFGGELGKSARILLTENVIGYAPFHTLIREQVRSYSQEITSLAVAPAFKFLVEQLEAEDAILAQVYFPPVKSFQLSDAFLTHFEDSLREEHEALFSEISTLNSVLPKFEHIAIAHYFEEGSDFKDSYATVHLLFDDVENAVKARAELSNRLTLYHQHLPEIVITPKKVIESATSNHFVVSVKVQDKSTVLDEAMRPIEQYNQWVQDIVRGQFMPIYYFQD